jgi:hypothetical protein
MKKKLIYILIVILSGLAGAGLDLVIRPSENGIIVDASYNIEFSDQQIPAQLENDLGEVILDENIPTVEDIDGGLFKDDMDPNLGDKGWSETYNVSSPEAFKNDTLNKCIIANNYYGAQCVSLARAFWWSYADRDVSTCGTGMAKGMMDCADVNAGEDFVVMWKVDVNKIQAGDWLVFGGGQYGHIGMALGSVKDGYVALLGENQGGHSCGSNVGGSATNIINISVKNLIGFYRPKSYIKPDPEPVVTPEPVIPISGCVLWHVERGDTMSKIMLDCEGTVVYGEAMDNYAKSWYSLIYKPNQSVYDGWNSKTGVGLYAGDDIEHRLK